MSLSLFSVSVDCGDAAKLAGFWSEVLGRAVDADGNEAFSSIGMQTGGTDGPAFMFHRVPEGNVAKNRLHIDLVASDLDEEVDRIRGLGATKIRDVAEDGYQWVTLGDLEGNEFDIVAAP
jgi:hypothetical protein